ncbi:hypothetical protein GOP47_0007998 [Adiantum capillus-veneris]|uniref:Pentatricopeptide repeat-containing protein n=1 Tax=Adiantum capillus-veneris TaxID=13818 RepID=A0A9D4ZJU4_ADICA|nr:hypothetical protein GOP47_0007998 [Adiantum capillus-veneris]
MRKRGIWSILRKCRFFASHVRCAEMRTDPSTAAAEVMTLFQQGNTEQALQLLHAMRSQGLHSACDDTYCHLLSRCSATKALSQGRIIHAHIFKHGGSRPNSSLSYTLFCMYAKCSSLAETRAAFDNMGRRNVVAWTNMINEYAKQGPAIESLLLYEQMIQEGACPNNVTYLCVLRACSSYGVLRQGKLIHAHVILSSEEPDGLLGNAIIEMYAKCGNVEEAHYEFDLLQDRTVVSWNSLIAGYVKHSDYETAFFLFMEMELQGMEPDSITHLNILKACAASKDVVYGRLIHFNILNLGYETIPNVGNALVDMYCKCESLMDAWRTFQGIEKPHLEAWNALIAGCAQLGQAEEAFKLYNKLRLSKLDPGKVTYLSVLKACAALAAAEQGSAIHTIIKHKGLESDLFVASSLVDMHAKCGNLDEAHSLFHKMSVRSVVTWNTLIAGYALHGHAKGVFKLVCQMEKEGIHLNHATFVCLLFTCSHAGFLEEGCYFYGIMREGYCLFALMDHYCSMVDIFGRAGRLEEAVLIIRGMPFEPSSVVWKALLGGCRVCSDLSLAKHAAESLEQEDRGIFVLLSNIYAAGDIWEEELGA